MLRLRSRRIERPQIQDVVQLNRLGLELREQPGKILDAGRIDDPTAVARPLEALSWMDHVEGAAAVRQQSRAGRFERAAVGEDQTVTMAINGRRRQLARTPLRDLEPFVDLFEATQAGCGWRVVCRGARHAG